MSTLRYLIFICPVSGGIYRDPEGFSGSDIGPFGRGFIQLTAEEELFPVSMLLKWVGRAIHGSVGVSAA